MSDNYPVESKDLSSRGTKGIMATGAGLGLLGVNALLGIPIVGPLLSGALVLLGAIGFFGKTKTDKVTGGLMAVAGGVGLASIFFHGMLGRLLSLGGLGFLAFGLFNLISFAIGIRKKSQ